MNNRQTPQEILSNAFNAMASSPLVSQLTQTQDPLAVIGSFVAQQKINEDNWKAIWGGRLGIALKSCTPDSPFIYAKKVVFGNVTISVEDPSDAIALAKELCNTPAAIVNVMQKVTYRDQHFFMAKMGIEFFKNTLTTNAALIKVLKVMPAANQKTLLTQLDEAYFIAITENRAANLLNIFLTIENKSALLDIVLL